MIRLFPSMLLAAMLIGASGALADWEKLKWPSTEMVMGQEREGIRLGLWSEKAEYLSGERRDVWFVAEKQAGGTTTIGSGGTLYRDSFLYVTDAHDKTTKLPLSGPIDGMTDPSRCLGGISGLLSKLDPGFYRLIWKTAGWESNAIEITIR